MVSGMGGCGNALVLDIRVEARELESRRTIAPNRRVPIERKPGTHLDHTDDEVTGLFSEAFRLGRVDEFSGSKCSS